MPYGPEFAQFYDRHWRSFGETVAPRILAHVKPLVAGRRVLDLCCGTGASSQVFAENGWSVTGVDMSPDMVAIARRRAASAEWGGRTTYLVQDVTRLQLAGDPYDLVLCLYDSVNHLPGAEAVEAMAAGAAAMAAPGALLVLDLNTPRAFVGWADAGEVIEDEFGRLVVRGSYDQASGVASLHLEGHLRDAGGERREFVDTETEHLLDIEDLLVALAGAGWVDHRFATYADLTAEIGDPESVQRLVVVVRRP